MIHSGDDEISYRFTTILRFYEGVGFGVLKIEDAESEVLCTDSTALVITSHVLNGDLHHQTSTLR
jgi:hypothetical protein